MMLNIPQAWKVLSSYIYTMVPCFLILKTKYFTNVRFWILLFHWEFLFFHWKLSFVFLRKVKTCRINLVGVCNDFVRAYISRFIWIMCSTVMSMWCKKVSVTDQRPFHIFVLSLKRIIPDRGGEPKLCVELPSHRRRHMLDATLLLLYHSEIRCLISHSGCKALATLF